MGFVQDSWVDYHGLCQWEQYFGGTIEDEKKQRPNHGALFHPDARSWSLSYQEQGCIGVPVTQFLIGSEWRIQTRKIRGYGYGSDGGGYQYHGRWQDLGNLCGEGIYMSLLE